MVTVSAAIFWGLRVNLLEGFVYEWPRHFHGDFYNAMFGSWNGQGIYYGPVFVMESWLYRSAPRIFNEYFFAVADAPLVGLAFFFAAKAARLTGTLSAVAAALWLCYHWLTYSFSVAANPESIELVLLCAAWYFATRRHASLGLAAAAVAALTKRIPAIFIPLMLMTERSWRSVISTLLVMGAIVAVVGLGQGLAPADVVRLTLNPVSLPFSGQDNVREVLAQPFPYPSQFLGLSNALARAAGEPMDDWALPFFQGYYYVVLLATLSFAWYVAFQMLRGRYRIAEHQGLTLSFCIFFGLMPLAAITTHPHTFIFLLPTWTALIALIASERRTWRQRALLVLTGVTYLFTGFPAAVTPIDRRLGTHLYLNGLFQDPIWLNLLLLGGLFAYAAYLLRHPAESVAQESDEALERAHAPNHSIRQVGDLP